MLQPHHNVHFEMYFTDRKRIIDLYNFNLVVIHITISHVDVSIRGGQD